MGTAENSSWTRIQQGIKDIERLIGQKQNNLAMVKSRQILEYMVKCLGEKALIVEGDLSDSIDQLYEGRWISQSTKDHFHRIRVLGNKAVHDGNDSAYDANEAYHLLSQEIPVFANHHDGKKSSSSRQPQAAAGSRQRTTSSTGGSQQRRSTGTNSRSGAAPSRSRRRSPKRRTDPMDLLKPILILVVIFLIAIGVKSCVSGKDKNKEASAPETTPAVSTEAMATTETPETEAETETPKIYKAASKLNVRTEPNTTSTKLGTLAVGTLVEYVGEYDGEWTIITFEGKQAYVATQYLSVEEAAAPQTPESESTTQP